MKKVNLITKKQADEKAQNYFENSKVPSLYVTRDGQIFLKGSESFMVMHEKDCKLEKSWTYFRDADMQIVEKTEEPEIKKEKEEKKVNVNDMSLQALKAHADKLIKSKKIKKDDLKDLDYKGLKNFLKDK